MSLDSRIRGLFEGSNFAPRRYSDGGWFAPGRARLDWDRGWKTDRRQGDSARAAANLRRDPRATISVNSMEDPYEEAHIRGRVAEFRGEPDAATWLSEVAVS